MSDPITANALVESHLHLVPAVVSHCLSRPPGEIPYLQAAALDTGDLESLGYAALMRAAATWNPASGAEFRTVAIITIRHTLKRHLYALRGKVSLESLEEPLEGTAGVVQSGRAQTLPVLGETLRDPDADTEAAALAPLEAAFVWACVWRYLTRRQALVLWWHYADDLTFEEIGQRLGVRRQEVKRSHTEAVHRLRWAGLL